MSDRRALIVGVSNYHPRIGPLPGCVNDAYLFRDLLLAKYGCDDGKITFLLNERATRTAVLDALHALVASSQPGDVAVFFYSGHGTRLDNPDDPSGKDEALVAYSDQWPQLLAGKDSANVLFEKSNWALQFIRDKEIKACLAPLAHGVNLTLVADCCHSGDINKLGGEESARFVEPSLNIREAIMAAQRSFWELENSTRPRATVSSSQVFSGNRFDLVQSEENNILLAACSEVQTSWERKFNGSVEGVFTHYLRYILYSRPAVTHGELIGMLGDRMRFEAQTPRLSCASGLRSHLFLEPLI